MQRIRIIFLLAVFFLGALSLKSQIDSADLLKKRFESYAKDHLTEKLFAHTDKNLYLAGEILWLKLYDVDGYFHLPLGISRIAYVELLDRNHQPRTQVMIPLDSGRGDGSIFLPVSLGSGNYILRAYTSWMKNFGADYFFEKQISIINTQKVLERPAPQQVLSYDIGFYPEGGSLVNSIPATVGFRVTDRYGRGVQSAGWLCEDQADTLKTIASLKFGMGHFEFTPLAHHRYKVIIRLAGGEELVKELPLADDSGYVMKLIDNGGDQIRVDVRQSATIPSQENPDVFLFIHTRGLFKLARGQFIQDGLASFSIEKGRLGEGISQLTVFDSRRRPVCERLFFKYPQRTAGFQIQINQQDPGPRKKIQLSIHSGDQDGKPIAANCSIAVYRLDSLQSLDEENIGNYLWLTSDLQGPLDSPAFYFKGLAAETAPAMDNLMLTQGWRRFRWEEILTGKKTAFEFLPEVDGHILSGKITDLRTGKGARNVEGFLSIPGTWTQMRSALSDQEGKVRFLMKDFFGAETIIAQTKPNKDSDYHIDMASPFSGENSKIQLPEFSMPEKAPATLLDKSISMQARNLYLGDRLKEFNQPLVDTTSFYGEPDERYFLDHYTRYTTMEEVLREYVRAVNVEKKEGKFHLPLSDLYTKQPYDQDPLVLLDGVPVFDMNKIVTYDPLRVRKIDVVARKYSLGYSSFNGILNFSTYAGDLSGFDLDPHAVTIDYEGLQLQRIFYAPKYDTELQINSHLPDFRDLLYWVPDLTINKQGKGEIGFYSSDLAGKYAIVIQGLTETGIPASQIAFFRIN